MIPMSVIEDDSMHTMHYSQCLPYADLLDNEANHWLQEIRSNLVASVKAKDFTGGVLAWVKRLSNYMDMKHAIDRDTRVHLAKLLYEMAVIPGMNPPLIDLWATVCLRLIRHRKRLEPEDLELPWRPIFDMLDKTIFPKSRQRTLAVDSKYILSIFRLVDEAKRYFSATATQEILDELLPIFSTHTVSQAMRCECYLVLLLPCENQSFHTVKSQDYLSTIFSLWSMFTMSRTQDNQFNLLMGRMAEFNIKERTGEVGIFTKEQIKSMFTVCLRVLNLPVGSNTDGGESCTGYGPQQLSRTDLKMGSASLIKSSNDRFKALATFIIYTMMPEKDGKSFSLQQLADLIQGTEIYFHPSNYGNWSYSLPELIRQLVKTFLKRWREEQEEDCKTPLESRLTPEIKKEFVLAIRPVAFIIMFGKDHFLNQASQSILKHLAWLEPTLIFPGLLERIYPSLETLTETHRTTSALGTLMGISLPLFTRDHYPAGGKHLLPLLHLSIPGIDMNDPIKTLSSLIFISSALMTVPIMDLSSVPSNYYPVEDDMDGELSRETEDYLTKASTGEFEEWLAKFMRRVFVIFENLPQESPKKSATFEKGIAQLMLNTCEVIFNQLSDRLFDLVLRLVVEFVGDRVLPHAVRSVGQLCELLTSVNPKKVGKVLIPLCIANTQTELEHGASSTVAHAASSNLIPSDATFHWYQNILFSTVTSMGADVLVYKQELIDMTHLMLEKCRSRRGMMWTGKLIRAVLSTLLTIYPLHNKSLNPSRWNDTKFMEQNAHLLWGQQGDPANIEIEWHVPSEEEKNVALEYMSIFLTPAMERLKTLTGEQGNSHEISNEFCRLLAIVRNCMMGSGTMVADDGIEEESVTSELALDEDEGDVIKAPLLEAGYAFTDENDPRLQQARTIRRQVGELIHQLSVYFKENREDDVESIKVLIKLARVFLSERGVTKSEFNNLKGRYSYVKNLLATPLCKKRYPRYLLIRRAHIHHLLRLRQNSSGRTRTPIHDAILSDLLEFSLGPYAEIRKFSQNVLSSTSRNFRNSKAIILPILLQALAPNVPADRMKGALYLLQFKSIFSPCLRNWKFIPQFVLAMCGAQHQEKLTIQELVRKVFVNYIALVNTFHFCTLKSEHLDKTLELLSPDTVARADYITTAKAYEEKSHQHNQDNLKIYEGLLVQLLDFLDKPNNHWRYATMAANFIEVFIRSDATPTLRLASFANEATLSELPTLRRIGISATVQMLLMIKQRTFAKGDADLLMTKNTRNPLMIDVQVGQEEGRKLLHDSYQPLSQDSVLVDSVTLGWYVWPERYTAYKINAKDYMFADGVDPASKEAFDEFSKTFNTSEYWEKLCSYMSQEVDRKAEDRFTSSHARLYSSIFQTFGDGPLKVAKPHLEKMLQVSDQKNSQRAAAEILAGLIRGTKHWSLAKLDHMWTWLTPLLQKVFASITPDSLTYWEHFVRFATLRRDPRRIQPLMNVVLEAELDPTSDAAFNESRKLLLTRALIVSLQWRMEPLIDRILPTYLDHLQHPYKQVREVMGVNINELLQLEWIPSYPSVKELLELNSATDGVGNVPTTLTPKQKERTQVLLNRLDQWLIEMNQSKQLISGLSDYAQASKTILCWLHEATTHWGVSGTIPYVVPFLPQLFQMQELKDDQDLSNMASRVLVLTARLNYPPSMIPVMVDQYLNILTTSPSWHIRVRALPVLQLFFFKHLFLLSSQEVIHIMQVVGNMLMDTQIEVRQLASVTLGGLVRCSQRDAIQSLLKEFSAKLVVRVPKRKRDPVTGKNVEPAGFAEAVLHKHAGVLGISCLIDAFPYEVPEWMPSILCQLADCISDPAAEIQATIRKTFSDFRRTHSDTWHEDMLKFDEDQLSVLSDMLISPSYYA